MGENILLIYCHQAQSSPRDVKIHPFLHVVLCTPGAPLMSFTVSSDIRRALCLLDTFSCHLDVLSDRPPGNPRVLEEEDAQIPSAVGAS